MDNKYPNLVQRTYTLPDRSPFPTENMAASERPKSLDEPIKAFNEVSDDIYTHGRMKLA